MSGHVLPNEYDPQRIARARESHEYRATTEEHSMHYLLIGLLAVAASTQIGDGETKTRPPGSSVQRMGRTDTPGDILPSGAIFRLGSIMLRHSARDPVSAVAFSPDGKTIISSGGVSAYASGSPLTKKSD